MAKPKMNGFATLAELETRRAREGSFLLGSIHPDHGAAFPAGIRDDRHLFMIAGSRAGKGVTMIIPNLIHWPGGVLCIDPKGENASITAMRRGKRPETATGTEVRPGNFLGQNVAILDPFGTVRGPARLYRTRYDPLGDVEVGTDEEAAQILALAESIVLNETGSGAHFSESAQSILAGLMEAVLHREEPQHRTLAVCREKTIGGSGALLDYLDGAPTTDADLAAEAATLLGSVGEEEGGSFISTLSRQLKWLADPRMQRHLEDSRFSLVRALREGWSVYICIPPSKIPSMKRWMRAIVRVALDAKMATAFEHRGPQTLFLLDEFYALGHIQLIEDATAYMAGYGIKLLPVIQNIGQVKKLYDKNWETFLGNAGAIIAWGLNDLETEKYVSDRMGPILEWERTYSDSRSRQPDGYETTGISHSANLSLREQAIRWPSDIHAEGARQTMRAFVISADGAPFTVRRVPYTDWQGQGVFDSPQGIRAWEACLTEDQKSDLSLL
ncbi:type IV secretory system conjugative DNA transfer family protein [Methylobacterium sp. NEAU 140]|uniref:type IV secretory system conjugative DNA transfer family protein n=1 Tax=Methylobacterium sp. NEAU 140 TaxID=3064945 RepID=UPI0027374F51|nr:type IV secretory system conjugative DNA transfer family protein [Methylobacterium sp. NEAU 140]MDP4026627.1 type IV secretory system conjugative DNA transfer family protein [Methylobacterium sp. NEAU 140]